MHNTKDSTWIKKSPLILIVLAVIAIGIMFFIELNSNRKLVTKEPKTDWIDAKIKNEAIRWLEKKYHGSIDTAELNKLSIEKWDLPIEFMDSIGNALWLEYWTNQVRGIGIEFTALDSSIIILDVLEKSTSEQAGLKPGMTIHALDKKSIIEFGSFNEIAAYLRSAENTISLQVKAHEGEQTSNYEISKTKLDLSRVYARQRIDSSLLYIKPGTFNEKAYNGVMRAIEELTTENEPFDLILDMRSNPGENIEDVAKFMAQLVSGKGNILFKIKGDRFKTIEYKSTGKVFYQIENIVLLIDENTGIAGVVLAHCLQELKRGKVIGTAPKTQNAIYETVQLSGSAALRIPIADVISASGINITNFKLQNKEGSDIDEANPSQNMELEVDTFFASKLSVERRKAIEDHKLILKKVYHFYENWLKTSAQPDKIPDDASQIQSQLYEEYIVYTGQSVYGPEEMVWIKSSLYQQFLSLILGNRKATALSFTYDPEVILALKVLRNWEG
jgi:carboxyl-terminal processing protease